MTDYLDNSFRADGLSGGERMIPVSTSSGTHQVWTKRIGNNPDCQMLILHGGPGATHEYLLGFDSFLPAASIEYYHYDQLGSGWSDHPEDLSYIDLDRFVDEVEQVRVGLGLDSFFLYGQSWGGILGIEYALAHPENLAGLVVSNMMASIPAYNAYASEVLIPAQDPETIARIKAMEAAGQTDDPVYDDLLMGEHYIKHVLRMPAADWPAPVVRSLSRINKDVYVSMQGPSELGASGKLVDWDRFDDLARLSMPTLVIGAQHDTMDPGHLRAMAAQIPQGEYLHCPNGSHLAMYDDQQTYMAGLTSWLRRQSL